MDTINASKICSRVSVAERGVFSRIVIPWRSESPGKTSFATRCLKMALSCATIVPHFMMSYITLIPTSVMSTSATAGNENRVGCSPDSFFPVWRKMVWKRDYSHPTPTQSGPPTQPAMKGLGNNFAWKCLAGMRQMQSF